MIELISPFIGIIVLATFGGLMIAASLQTEKRKKMQRAQNFSFDKRQFKA